MPNYIVTALRDEQPAVLHCLAFGRTLSHRVDLARRSLADLFVGSSTVGYGQEIATTQQKADYNTATSPASQ